MLSRSKHGRGTYRIIDYPIWGAASAVPVGAVTARRCCRTESKRERLGASVSAGQHFARRSSLRATAGTERGTAARCRAAVPLFVSIGSGCRSG